MKIIALLVLVILSSSCLALEKIEKSWAVTAKKLLPESDGVLKFPELGAHGYINDGNRYMLIGYNTTADKKREEKEFNNDQDHITRFAVFRVTESGLNLVLRTKGFVGYPRDTWSFRISGREIHVIKTNTGSYVSLSNKTWKFRVIDNKFMLVGYENVFSEFPGSDHVIPYIETATSVNFITDKAIQSRREGNDAKLWSKKEQWEKPFKIVKATKNKEFQFKFDNTESISLETFDDELFEKWYGSQKNLCGWIDADFKYKTCDDYKKLHF